MAGFFGLFDYSKPGKGVRKDEPKRSHFAMFWILVQRKFWKLIQLNFLFLVFCIPLVAVWYLYGSGIVQSAVAALLLAAVALLPVGPALSGLTYVLRNYTNEQPVFLLSDFWDAFKNNFTQSAIYCYLAAVAAVVMVIAGNFYYQGAADNSWLYVPLGLILMIALLFIFANFYIFQMIVTLDLPLKAIIKNGFLLAVLCIKSNLITLFILALVYFAGWLFGALGTLAMTLINIVIGFSFFGFLVVHNSYRGIRKYAIDPYMDSLEAASEEIPGENVFNDEQLLKEDEEK